MKPVLKLPGTSSMLLKLRYDVLLNSFAFKLNLRRYIMGCHFTQHTRVQNT
jgi:hypothetical protein